MMRLKCLEATDSNGTELYLFQLEGNLFISIPKEQEAKVMNYICERCEINDCDNCPLWWNDDPTLSEVLMLDD